MKGVSALVWLTFKAAIRYRLFVVLNAVMLGAVILLPLVIKDDGTAHGFTQILLTYTVSAITALLGLATLWLSCGSLARDIEDCQMQLLAVKPIARWQIWIGKWSGIMLLNILLLAIAGTAVFLLLQFRATKLDSKAQNTLYNEVLVARNSAKPSVPNLEPDIEQFFQQRIKEISVTPGDYPQLRRQIAEQVRAQFQLIPSGYARPWKIELGALKDQLKDQPLYLRVRFAAAGLDMSVLTVPRSFMTYWQIGDPKSSRLWRSEKSLAAEAYHEFLIPPNLFDANGVITIECLNPNPEALLFQLEDGIEVLYREGGFGLNFMRGLGIILCWLSLLAAIGLCAGSFLSFPVASFFSVTILIVGLSGGTVSQVVEEGGVFGVNHETGRVDNPGLLDQVLLPAFRGLLAVIKMAEGFSPVDSLSTGRSVTWGQLGQAACQITLLMGGLFAATGIWAFNRRELAAVQVNQ